MLHNAHTDRCLLFSIFFDCVLLFFLACRYFLAVHNNQALLVETAAYAFDQPGVAMPPNPKAHDGGGDGGDDDDEDGEDDDDVGDGAGAGGGGAGGAARAARKQLEAAARAEAAAAKAAEAAAALAAIEIPKATAAEQLRLVKSLVKMAFRVPGRKGFLGETKQVLDKEGFVTFLEHYSVTEAVFDKVFVEGMRFPNPRTGNHLGPFLIPAVSRLLSPCDVAMLYYAVPDEIRDDWSLCFSSDRDGGTAWHCTTPPAWHCTALPPPAFPSLVDPGRVPRPSFVTGGPLS